MTEFIRAFIALEVSPQVLEELARLQDELKASMSIVKWVRPDSIHLTLKFLGNIPEAEVPDISKMLDDIANQLSPFEVTLNDIGVFPSWQRPSVIWAGLSGGEKVELIAERIEEALENQGFKKEKRKFSPHLTLGRIKSGKNKERLKELALEQKPNTISMAIDKIILFKSTLTPKGAVYEVLHTSCFKD